MMTLQQDNHDKIVINIEEDKLIQSIKKYFKWRKGDMIKRLSDLGSKDYDEFIKYLFKNN